MNHSNYWISLDINKIKSQLNLTLKQGETGRTIHISLTEDGRPYQISEGCYATFAASKSVNNETVILSHGCTIQDNTIKYSVQPETTAHTGLVECEIMLYSADDQLIISSSFSITVFNNTYTEVEDESPKEQGTLAKLISEANALIYNVNKSLKDGDLKGVGITSIKKTATEGDVDTYTITLSDDTFYTFTVTNANLDNAYKHISVLEKVLYEWVKADLDNYNGATEGYDKAYYTSKDYEKPTHMKGIYTELVSGVGGVEHEFDIVCDWSSPDTTDNETIDVGFATITYTHNLGEVILYISGGGWKEVYCSKTKVKGNIAIDDTLSHSSKNAVQNKVITEAFDKKVDKTTYNSDKTKTDNKIKDIEEVIYGYIEADSYEEGLNSLPLIAKFNGKIDKPTHISAGAATENKVDADGNEILVMGSYLLDSVVEWSNADNSTETVTVDNFTIKYEYVESGNYTTLTLVDITDSSVISVTCKSWSVSIVNNLVDNLQDRVTYLERNGTGSSGGGSVELDTTLTEEGKAADAKAVGDAIEGVRATASNAESAANAAISIAEDANNALGDKVVFTKYDDGTVYPELNWRSSYGIIVDGKTLKVYCANATQTLGRSGSLPIAANNAPFAVKGGLVGCITSTDERLTLTDDQKKAVQAWLGIDEYHPLPQWITMSNEMAAQNEATLPYKISKPTAINCWFIKWDDEAINREDLDFNVSNISWNGDEAYIEQHGEIFKIMFEIRDYGGGSIFTVMTFGCETNGNVVFDNYSPIEVYAAKEN